MEMVTSSNGHKRTGPDHPTERRHPRWTRQETLSLIQAKDITENSPHKGKKVTSFSPLMGPTSENTEPKWVTISSYCKQHGVNRGPAQCRKRWSNLIADFKKVKAWESKLTDKAESFWTMRNDLRKERKLPVSFDTEVFRVMEEREKGSAYAASPLPLQAVSAFAVAAVVSDDTNEYGDEDGEGGEEEETGDDVEEEEHEEEVQKEEDKNIPDNVTESPIREFCAAEPISEHHHQPSQDQNRCSSQGDFRESWPGISYWDSQERGKRPRLSTDNHQINHMEASLMKILETNNKMLNAQLDAHNKNCQLDRDQRKESNDMLAAAIGRLSDVLVKIAEKL